MHNRVSSSKAALLRSLGASVHTLAAVILVGLIPYTLFAGYGLFVAISATTGASIGELVYAAARFAACLLLAYALWRLRQAAARLRDGNPPVR